MAASLAAAAATTFAVRTAAALTADALAAVTLPAASAVSASVAHAPHRQRTTLAAATIATRQPLLQLIIDSRSHAVVSLRNQ
jgi:hypothetical protein